MSKDIVCPECVAFCEHIGNYTEDEMLVERWGCPVCGEIYRVLVDETEETPPASDHPDLPIII